MRINILILFCFSAITACAPVSPMASPPASITIQSAPQTAPQTQSQGGSSAQASIAFAPQALTQPELATNALSMTAIPPTHCAFAEAAPLGDFRSDPPSKLVSAEPRLVEFFACW